MSKRLIDILVYALAALLDSFGVAIMIKTAWGATPFGILTSNEALNFPLTVGVCSFLTEVLYIFIAGKVSGGRIKWELLIYSFIFGGLIDLDFWFLRTMSLSGWVDKLLITLMALVFLDLAKSLFKICVYPKLSSAELIFQLTSRFKWNLNISSKAMSLFNITIGCLFAWVAGKTFNNVGIGTLLALVFLGFVLQWVSPHVDRGYRRLTLARTG